MIGSRGQVLAVIASLCGKPWPAVPTLLYIVFTPPIILIIKVLPSKGFSRNHGNPSAYAPGTDKQILIARFTVTNFSGEMRPFVLSY